MKMIFTSIFAVFVVFGQSFAQDPTPCCAKGYQIGAQALVKADIVCKPGASVTSGFKGLLKQQCNGLFRVCCKTAAESQFCSMGVTQAAANHICIKDKRVGGKYQQICCNCCKKGKIHGTKGEDCAKSEDEDDYMCSSAFQNCCEMAKTGKGDGKDETKGKKEKCKSVNCQSADRECAESKNGANWDCVCKLGLREEAGSCVDIDECASTQFNCTNNSHCVNTKGSYKCECSDGFQNDGGKCVTACTTGYKVINGTCKDFDECLARVHRCPTHTYCMNTVGDYRCVNNCPYPNYEVVKRGVCADVDECVKGISNCHRNYECINKVGSFDCKRVRCDAGYKLVNGFCDDIDECLDDENICGEKGLCRNAHGRYYCDCQTGYAIDPSTGKCADVDECKLHHQPSCNHQCINTEGSYRCKCPNGYEMRGRYCYDNDECKNDPCTKGTYCFNTFGSYECINETCPNKHFIQTSRNHCRKKDCKKDPACTLIQTQSIKWRPFRMHRSNPVQWFQFTYTISGFNDGYQFHFAIVSGNEDQIFDTRRIARGKVKIVNAKPMKGPNKYVITMHADVTKGRVLIQRYKYIFYIFLSPYDF